MEFRRTLRTIKRVSKFWNEYAGKRATEKIGNKEPRGFIRRVCEKIAC
jgi:hypothetical protein